MAANSTNQDQNSISPSSSNASPVSPSSSSSSSPPISPLTSRTVIVEEASSRSSASSLKNQPQSPGPASSDHEVLYEESLLVPPVSGASNLSTRSPSRSQNARGTGSAEATIASQLRLSLASFRRTQPKKKVYRRAMDLSDQNEQTSYSLGIAAMAKKLHSKPFQRVMEHLVRAARKDNIAVEIIEFTPDILFDTPISQWPVVDCLVAFFSSGFPLEKAIAYCELYPHIFQVNDLQMQQVLKDRQRTYDRLKELGVPLARYAVAHRSVVDGPSDPPVRQVGDFLFVGDKKFVKPFVEKPVDADDHDIWIYYPMSQGGGVRQLFRKQDNQSSAFSQRNAIRTDRSYIYEEYLMSERLDCKVYAVGTNYTLCQQRKSPTSDGTVERTVEGHERRRETKLSPPEQHIARKIVQGFRQTVCGFDMLRAPRNTYVCDVNGWSSVKSNSQYWKEAGSRIHRTCLEGMFGLSGGSSRTSSRSSSRASSRSSSRASSPTRADSSSSDRRMRESTGASTTATADEPIAAAAARLSGSFSRLDNPQAELLGMVCVFRHADRTPKQKLKYHTSEPSLLSYVRNGRAFKLKNTTPMSVHALSVELADHIENLRTRMEAEPGSSPRELAKLRTMVNVLRQSRAGTKVQMKPASSSAEAGETPQRALLIVKWGGILTDAGIEQAQSAGQQFFDRLAPELPPRARSQWTSRLAGHVYTNEERRVHLTAVHLTSAMIDAECWRSPSELSAASSDFYGSLSSSPDNGYLLLAEDLQTAATPQELKDDMVANIAVRPRLLDGVDAAGDLIGHAKTALSENAHSFQLSPDFEVLMPTDDDLLHTMKAFPTYKQLDVRDSLRSQQTVWQNRFQQLLFLMCNQIYSFVAQLDELLDRYGKEHTVYANELLSQMVARWRQLGSELYDIPQERFDVSKVPTCYDYTKYDSLHNRELSPELAASLRDMAHTASWLASLVIGCEYGVTRGDKVKIGSLIAQPLLEHIVHRSLRMFRSPSPASRLALYFTSESHMVALMNLLVCSPEIDSDFYVQGELNYLSCICFKLYEVRSTLSDYYVDIFISTGAEHDIFGTCSPSQHVLPISPSVFVQRVPLIDLCTVAVPYSVLYEDR